MRHRKGRNRLSRTSSHAKAMLSNLVTSLFQYERVTTSLRNAKEGAKLAEKMITIAKGNTLHNRRTVLKTIKSKTIVGKLFNNIAPRYSDTNGGYTRIFKLANPRLGDGASLAMLDLIGGLAEKKLEQAESLKDKKVKKKKVKEEAKTTEEKNTEKKTAKKTEEKKKTASSTKKDAVKKAEKSDKEKSESKKK